jgi:4-hydroxysphinganine ceramide fatty acyl 2-hydroxylase
LIFNYKNRDLSHELKTHHVLTYRMADSLVIGSFANDITKVIDPTKPLMKQVWSLNHQQYLDLVDSPHWLFVESPRMFEYDLLEATSHNKWYHILILHMAFSIYMLTQVVWQHVSVLQGVFLFLLGMFSFSLLEYVLHRFLFHSEKYLFDNKIVRYLHFLLHGIHHMLPVDP